MTIIIYEGFQKDFIMKYLIKEVIIRNNRYKLINDVMF